MPYPLGIAKLVGLLWLLGCSSIDQSTNVNADISDVVSLDAYADIQKADTREVGASAPDTPTPETATPDGATPTDASVLPGPEYEIEHDCGPNPGEMDFGLSTGDDISACTMILWNRGIQHINIRGICVLDDAPGEHYAYQVEIISQFNQIEPTPIATPCKTATHQAALIQLGAKGGIRVTVTDMQPLVELKATLEFALAAGTNTIQLELSSQ